MFSLFLDDFCSLSFFMNRICSFDNLGVLYALKNSPFYFVLSTFLLALVNCFCLLSIFSSSMGASYLFLAVKLVYGLRPPLFSYQLHR